MPTIIKDFKALKTLRTVLQAHAHHSPPEALAQEDEQALFRNSVGIVQPLTTVPKFVAPPLHLQPIPYQHLADEQAALQESLSDSFNEETLLQTDETLSFSRNGISPEVMRKLRKGSWTIQQQLDLHGLRRDEARVALSEFLHLACQCGWRCVRIIHGKGLGSIDRKPVLKFKVRIWLMQKQEVLAFCQATPAQGGAGAILVLLKGKK